MENIIIEKLKIEDMNDILEILKQDCLRGYNGQYAVSQKNWISHFIDDKNCFAFGLYQKNILISVLLAERLSYDGCILWYIAVKNGEQGKRYGTKLLDFFEKYAKNNSISWIFLNATNNSLDFYKKRKYITSDFSKVYEHVKDL